MTPPATSTSAASSRGLRPDQQVGSYRVLRELGRGGMATVYEAVHRQISQRAAIKVLAADLASDPVMTTRFLNEARAVNIVRHPGLVSIFEFGQLDAEQGGGAFIVMELLLGESLAERLRRSAPLPTDEALRLCRQIASALAAAHDKGIVHRDLKPGNVMIVSDPDMAGGERTKILDFGIAKLSDLATQPMTQTGAVLGTPSYMSPEQCNGADLVTDRTDVYALGVILFEMLSGALPFQSERPMEVLGMHLFREPPDLVGLVPGLPGSVASLVATMLTKEVEARPSMAQVARALQELGALGSQVGLPVPPALAALAPQAPARPSLRPDGETVVAMESPTLVRSAAGAPRRRWLVGLVLLGLVLLPLALWLRGAPPRSGPVLVSKGAPPSRDAPARAITAPPPAGVTSAPAPQTAAVAATPPVEEPRPRRSRRRESVGLRVAPPRTPRTPRTEDGAPTAPVYRGTKAAIDTTYPGSP